ncbi:hypothetical protein PAN31117_05074 [Pandoraea anapnoica]|uniref:Uncharacterized protein n=1 Tax=Pandoraea anapnoica TaxID=2508301 RepID=A0A5E5AQJ3_9BURK|nr:MULTISPECIES: hypothetical protein [Pandoraea]VVE58581.1 hypothetical protein PIN31009_05326 [Pandoraea iniqua]VVE75072.1 hypothetical protein PAN31117_05074 [Pandoraea anapnoica]
MLKKTLASAAVAMLLVNGAHAFPSFSGKTTGTQNSAPAADASGAQAALVSSYADAGREVLIAQSYLADAVGLKELSAKAKATAESLGSGATKDSLQDSDKMMSDTSIALQEQFKAGNLQMDASSKKAYSEGMQHLGSGILRYAGLHGKITDFSNEAKAQLESSSVMDKMAVTKKLSTGTYIVSETPKQVSNLGSTLKTAAAFATSQDIPVPKDATAALSAKF